MVNAVNGVTDSYGWSNSDDPRNTGGSLVDGDDAKQSSQSPDERAGTEEELEQSSSIDSDLGSRVHGSDIEVTIWCSDVLRFLLSALIDPWMGICINHSPSLGVC